ncbi:MFS general substrate transporter-28 [Coleophoma crateriformis]|uniref:MFS general substrate transporter-28 n=1 Tax=Coleophoma crateriformis TaxID=565419 RepID=A0A3D8RDS9_9HELO|nr:MFS general substrate transporter-28 [Coleophoma crateriformis]
MDDHAKDITATEVEHAPSTSPVSAKSIEENDALHGFQAEESSLPKGYYRSSFFIGTMFATGLGLAAGVGGFALAAPNLGVINADIGPDANLAWVALVYTLTLAVGLLLVGRLSDLFGRRWFFICGSILALIGNIVAATAQSIPALIGATTLIGLAASTQLSFSFVSNELVPMKYRFLTNAWLYLWTVPISGLGPAISKAFILRTSSGWRWCYYLMIILNALSGLLYFCFYHPPTFNMKFKNRSKLQQFKDFDFVGCLLFTGGLLLFVMGLSWGGGLYPWKSGHVIGTVVSGALGIVAFFLWEIYVPLKEPVVPMHLFKNIEWVASCLLLSLGASVYYAMATIWPSMVAVLYTDDGGASMYAGWLNCISGTMIVAGQICAGCFAVAIGKTKFQCITVLIIGGALLGAMASCTPDSKDRAIVLMTVGCFAIGWNESVCLANAGIEIEDQQEIGTAVGMAGSIRSAISTVCSSIYTAVLINRLGQTIPAEVPPAIVAAGLPASSVPAFLGALTTGNFSGVQGLTTDITLVGVKAYKQANAHAYSTVFLTSLAFSGLAIVISFWSPNVDERMTGEVATTLHQRDKTLVGDNKLYTESKV